MGDKKGRGDFPPAEFDESLGPEWREAFPVPFDQRQRERMPYATRYCMLYGMHRLMSREWTDIRPYRSQEEVYRACIEKGCTWEKLLDDKGVRPDVLL